MSATEPVPVEVEPLTSLADFDRCVDLQVAIWNYSAGDLIPRRMFLLASRIGGQVLGGFTLDAAGQRTLAGFAMALPGYRNGHPYLHSHMVGVLPEFRNRGLARTLKLAQRTDALARGFALMEWTFDPLEIKNAHLNIARLGAVVRRYAPDFYGPSSSPLQGGLPTDRVYAEWWLRSQRVEETLAAQVPAFTPEQTIGVPAEIYAWKSSPEHRDRARAVQAGNAAALQAAFARGLTVLGYAREPDGSGTFQLGHWNENLRY